MKNVLLVSIGYSPNVGGIETHFNDLVSGLIKRKWSVTVLTYQPITSKKRAQYREHHSNLNIYRLPIFRGLFYRLVTNPILEFIYLTPGLFIGLFLLLIKERKRIQVIHSHGLIAGFVSVFWGRIFRLRVITTTHSVYEFPREGLYRKIALWIFGKSDTVLCLSDQSVNEILELGVEKRKVKRFVYWVDSNRFHRIANAKKKLGFQEGFLVLFVGRLVSIKGVEILLQSLKKWPQKSKLMIAGIGPLSQKVIKFSQRHPEKLQYLGKLKQEELPLYYSAADAFIIPSINEEGFGRVIIESLMCGTPVIGANKGAIPEAMNESVGALITPSAKSITQTVKKFIRDTDDLHNKQRKARSFALKRYSEKNINMIIKAYSSVSA